MNPRKAEKIFSERKRDNGENTWLGKVKTPLESENVALIGENAFIERKRRSQRRNSFCRAKSSLAKAKMRLPSQNVSHKAITGIPSEDVRSKGENAFRERKRGSLR